MTDDQATQRRALQREYATALAHERFGTEGEYRSTNEIARDIASTKTTAEPRTPTGGAARGLAEAERRFPLPQQPPQPPSAFDQARADQANRERAEAMAPYAAARLLEDPAARAALAQRRRGWS